MVFSSGNDVWWLAYTASLEGVASRVAFDLQARAKGRRSVDVCRGCRREAQNVDSSVPKPSEGLGIGSVLTSRDLHVVNRDVPVEVELLFDRDRRVRHLEAKVTNVHRETEQMGPKTTLPCSASTNGSNGPVGAVPSGGSLDSD